MPRGDQTGPEGMGPKTGRGLGYCAGYSSPGFTRGAPRGRGFGRNAGFGRGRGFGRRQFSSFSEEPIVITKEEEKELLKEDIEALEQEKEYIEKRIKEIKEYIEKK